MFDIENKIFGIRIKYFRKMNKLTLEQFGEIVGVKKNNVLNWERGINKPLDDRLPIIAKTFGITIEELMSNEIETKLIYFNFLETYHFDKKEKSFLTKNQDAFISLFNKRLSENNFIIGNENIFIPYVLDRMDIISNFAVNELLDFSSWDTVYDLSHFNFTLKDDFLYLCDILGFSSNQILECFDLLERMVYTENKNVFFGSKHFLMFEIRQAIEMYNKTLDMLKRNSISMSDDYRFVEQTIDGLKEKLDKLECGEITGLTVFNDTLYKLDDIDKMHDSLNFYKGANVISLLNSEILYSTNDLSVENLSKLFGEYSNKNAVIKMIPKTIEEVEKEFFSF